MKQTILFLARKHRAGQARRHACVGYGYASTSDRTFRPELDSKRIGCVGISGGGTCTLFATALESRIRAALVSGYMNSFRDSVGSIAHCIDNYVPGILNSARKTEPSRKSSTKPIASGASKAFPF